MQIMIFCYNFSDDTDGFANFAAFSNQSSNSAVSQPSGSMPKSSAFFANFSPPTTSSSVAPPVPADKYSALADLESAFMAPAPSSSTVNWDSTMGGGSLGGGVSAGSGTSSWGAAGSSMFNGMGGLPASGNAFYGGSIATASTSSTLYNVAGGGGIPPAYAVSGDYFVFNILLVRFQIYFALQLEYYVILHQYCILYTFLVIFYFSAILILYYVYLIVRT